MDPKWCGSKIPLSLTPSQLIVKPDPSNNECKLPHSETDSDAAFVRDGSPRSYSIPQPWLHGEPVSQGELWPGLTAIELPWWTEYLPLLQLLIGLSKNVWQTFGWLISDAGLDLHCGKTPWFTPDIFQTSAFYFRFWENPMTHQTFSDVFLVQWGVIWGIHLGKIIWCIVQCHDTIYLECILPWKLLR